MIRHFRPTIAAAIALALAGCATVIPKEPFTLECTDEADCKRQASNFCGDEGFTEINRKELQRPVQEQNAQWMTGNPNGIQTPKKYLFLLVKCGAKHPPPPAANIPPTRCPVVEQDKAREWILPDGSLGYELPDDCGNDSQCADMAKEKCGSHNIAFFPASQNSIGKAVYQCLKLSNCEGNRNE